MQYRRLGRTNFMVSEIGIGGEWLERHTAEEVKEILDELCSILLETPANCIDAKTVKQKVMAAEFACHQKQHPIPEKTMQSMKFEAERAELNMSLKKG